LKNKKETINDYKRKSETKNFFSGKRDYIKIANNDIKKISYKLKNRDKLITK